MADAPRLSTLRLLTLFLNGYCARQSLEEGESMLT